MIFQQKNLSSHPLYLEIEATNINQIVFSTINNYDNSSLSVGTTINNINVSYINNIINIPNKYPLKSISDFGFIVGTSFKLQTNGVLSLHKIKNDIFTFNMDIIHKFHNFFNFNSNFERTINLTNEKLENLQLSNYFSFLLVVWFVFSIIFKNVDGCSIQIQLFHNTVFVCNNF